MPETDPGALPEGSTEQGDLTWDDVQDDLAASRPPEEAGAPQEEPAQSVSSLNLDFILDIPLQVTVELGRTKMRIHDLLSLGQGSVIELTKLVGEPLELLVNEKLVARGEVVVVNEKFGIRLTDVISPMERIEHLR
ncbi:MAG: flagellar motor switch protein FliN [Candidatus Tectomicrobia bacterium]|uniref:Flagellar motor switch protein FliN n=1 Tax=Tectimicrobiota bacterium TaxID=2528274 RepID=A0A932GMT4_UNCTE|nr:flagellar motor switch protein FliN [Candidatus Tectomicrobia bacterium]